MYTIFDPTIISTIMPILIAVIVFILALVLILVIGRNKRIASQAISQKAFEQLVNDLKLENASLQSELRDIKVTLESINKMMEDVQ